VKYEPRKYRELMGRGRFSSFTVVIEETDLWIGLGKSVLDFEKRNVLEKFIKSLRSELKEYSLAYPEFYKSHEPLQILEKDSENIILMKRAASEAGTGPMAAVAGFFAMKCLELLEDFFSDEEIIVENGGDLYFKLEKGIIINPFQVQNKNFTNLALEIDSPEKYLSVCSSSGVFGHSFSYGKADLVTVISKDACLADAWATSLANRIQVSEDIESICRELPRGITAVLAIKDEMLGYKGPYSFVRS
jgi:ApbE superfamily uncharacterized protein (UPF0280 family)